MGIHALLDLSALKIIEMTIRASDQFLLNEKVAEAIEVYWKMISLFPADKNERFYHILNRLIHTASHCQKIQDSEHVPNKAITPIEGFGLSVLCQLPKLIFNYRNPKEKLCAFGMCNLLTLLERPIIDIHISKQLIELDLSGIDFCGNDAFLIRFLPRCKSVQSLNLGRNGSDQVLKATLYFPLLKLELEDTIRFPLELLLCTYFFGLDVAPIGFISSLRKKCEKTFNKSGSDSCYYIPKLATYFKHRLPQTSPPCWPELKSLTLRKFEILEADLKVLMLLSLYLRKDLEYLFIDKFYDYGDTIYRFGQLFGTELGCMKELKLKHLALTYCDLNLLKFPLNQLNISHITLDSCIIRLCNEQFRDFLNSDCFSNLTSIRFENLRHFNFNFQNMNRLTQTLENLEIVAPFFTTKSIVSILTSCLKLRRLELDCPLIDVDRKESTKESIGICKSLKTLIIKQFLASNFDVLFLIFSMAPNIYSINLQNCEFDPLTYECQQLILSQSSSVRCFNLYPSKNLDLSLFKEYSRFIASSEKLELTVSLKYISDEDYMSLINAGWHIYASCHHCKGT